MLLTVPITDLLADFLLFSLVIVSRQEPYRRKSADQQNTAGVLELLFVPVCQCKHEQHFSHPPSARYLKPFPQHGIPQYQGKVESTITWMKLRIKESILSGEKICPCSNWRKSPKIGHTFLLLLNPRRLIHWPIMFNKSLNFSVIIK